jgi:methionine synthase II (cobalamin-independent)
MLKTTRDKVLTTAITGSYPRPLWFDRSLEGRSFKSAMGDTLFREQYQDAVAAVINAQEAAGLDILSDGDSRFDLAVGGKSWFFYAIERLGGISGHKNTSQGWMGRLGLKPGHILYEVQEAYQPAIVTAKLSRGPLEYAALWQVAQRLSDRPVKFGAICAPALASMLWNEHYADDKALVLDLCDIMNAEFKELAAAGCPVIQVEEPRHHGLTARGPCSDADLEFQTTVFNRQLAGVDAEVWAHTCWGNPNQQRVYWEVPSYQRALPYLLRLDADVVTFECASSGGKDLPLFAQYKTDKTIGIGVVSHCNTVVERPEDVAALIRRALEFIPPERLLVTTDCGFGREGLSRRIAYYKCVSLVLGTNIVRRELGLPEARVRAADPKLYFASLDRP